MQSRTLSLNAEQTMDQQAYEGGRLPSSSSPSSSAPAPVRKSRRSDLKLLIPAMDYSAAAAAGSADSGRPPLSPGGSGKSKKLSLPRPSNMSRVSVSPKPQEQQQQQQQSSVLLGRRTSSLPVTPLNNAVAISIVDVDDEDNRDRMSEKLLAKPKFERSLSAPLKKTRSLRSAGVVLVKSLSPRSKLIGEAVKDATVSATGDEGYEEDSQEIPAEQAVCRICMDDLGEDSKTLKTECSCKGELALAHEDCAIKWFVIKGNRMCDICGDEVRNLPVTLTRVSNDAHNEAQVAGHVAVLGCFWQDVPVLIAVSMLTYFCLLQELLYRKLKGKALPIALSFGCVLGLLATITASTLVARKYIWGYAVFQFVLIAVFNQVLYRLLDVEAVLAILLSAFAGLGIAMTVNGTWLELSSWRRRRASRLQQRNQLQQQQLQLQLQLQQQRDQQEQQQRNQQNPQAQSNVELESLSSPV